MYPLISSPKSRDSGHSSGRLLRQFDGLQKLCVIMVQGPPCPVDHYAADLKKWLEPLKKVTAPSSFQLMLPVDSAGLQASTISTHYEILGHP